RQVEDGDGRLADRSDGAEADDSADPVLTDGAVRERADGLANREVVPIGRGLVDRDLPVARRPPPGHELHRIEAPVGRRCGDAEGYALVRASDRAAVGSDEPRLVLDRALRRVDARE